MKPESSSPRITWKRILFSRDFWEEFGLHSIRICLVIGLGFLLLSVAIRLSGAFEPSEWFAIIALVCAVLIVVAFVLLSRLKATIDQFMKDPLAWMALVIGPVSVFLSGLYLQPFCVVFGIILAVLGSAELAWTKYSTKPQSRVRGAKEPEDRLHRRFFANRIARYLAEDNATLRRIAITGPWGDGKTRTLELVQSELIELLNRAEYRDRFEPRFVWINPWKASNKEEAWKVIADGFKEIRSPVGRVLEDSIWSWIQSCLRLLGYETVSQKVLTAIKTHRPNDATSILEAVDKVISEQNLRLFVFVDDMERAEPDAIRGILPVVDRLSEMKHCYFLFGIDRERLRDAFMHLDQGTAHFTFTGEKENAKETRSVSLEPRGNSSQSVTGYLDKMMDLQLALPPPVRYEIIEFARHRLKDVKQPLPKLEKAFDKLAPHLPLNARQCED